MERIGRDLYYSERAEKRGTTLNTKPGDWSRLLDPVIRIPRAH